METERRKAPRKTPAEFTFIKLEQEFGGRVLNCSEEGLCFETMSPINESDLIQFWFSLHTLERVEGFGQIVWMNQARNVGGIRITHLSRTSRQKFQGWLGDPAHIHISPPKEDSRVAIPSVPAASGIKAQNPAPVPETPALSTTVPLAADVPVELAMSGDPATADAGVPEPSQARHWPTSAATASPSIQSNFDSASPTGAVTESRDADRADALESQSIPSSAPLWLQGTSAYAEGDVVPPSMTGQPEPPEIFRWTTPLVTQTSSPESRNPWPNSQMETFASHLMAASEDLAHSIPSGGSPEYSDQPAVEPHELVPLTRHRNATRMQFIRGALLGILVCAAIAALVSKFSKPLGPSVSAQVASSPATAGTSVAEAQPNFEAPSSNLTQAISIPALTKVAHTGKRSGATSVTKIIPGAVQESSASPAGASNSDPAPTPEQVAAQNATPAPAASSAGNAVTAYHPAPLVQAPSLPIPPERFQATVDPRLAPTAAQPAPDSAAAVSYPSFHRANPVSSLQVGGEVRPARLIRPVQPVYPLAARSRNIAGDVVIDAVVSASGNVTQPRVLSGPSLLHQAALEAASQLKYEPALLDGKPTAQHVTITMKFHP